MEPGGLDRNPVNVGQVYNLPMRRKWAIHGRLQTCPTLPGRLAIRKVAIRAGLALIVTLRAWLRFRRK